MNLLLPHRFKKIGAAIAPTGLGLWLAMQLGYITKALIHFFGKPENFSTVSAYHSVKVAVAIISFFAFLGGIYFVTFSREQVEDEMVQRIRLDSFQFAALVQIIFTIAGFLFILLAGEPGEGGFMLFFIGLIFLFWLSFIGRFNYMLHIRLKP